jgi:colicin import membrane protein
VPDWLIRVYRNIWPITLALLVHVILFALMSVNLDWTRRLKPAAMQPIQAVAIIEPLPLSEPKIDPVVMPEPEPEPEPEPPKPKPEPEPIKKIFSYPCAGKQLDTDSEGKARALQAQCEEQQRKKKEAEEKKKQEELDAERKQKEAAEKKLEEEKRKKKEVAEKKRKEQERKKKEVEEKKRKEAELKKKAAAEKKRKEAERKKKAAAEKKRKQGAARKKAAADAKRKREAAAAAQREAARVEGEAGTAMGMAVGAIQAAVHSNWIQPRTSTIGLEVLVRVNVRPGGMVTSARVIKSSGNALFDRSAEIAVLKASPLPIPSNPRYYPYIKEFDFRFRPNG